MNMTKILLFILLSNNILLSQNIYSLGAGNTDILNEDGAMSLSSNPAVLSVNPKIGATLGVTLWDIEENNFMTNGIFKDNFDKVINFEPKVPKKASSKELQSLQKSLDELEDVASQTLRKFYNAGSLGSYYYTSYPAQYIALTIGELGFSMDSIIKNASIFQIDNFINSNSSFKSRKSKYSKTMAKFIQSNTN